MKDESEQKAAELFPCEHLVEQPGYYNDPATCFACSKRPAVAAALREAAHDANNAEVNRIRAELAGWKETINEEVNENCRIADRIGITEAIKAGKSYADAEIERFDDLRVEVVKLKAERELLRGQNDASYICGLDRAIQIIHSWSWLDDGECIRSDIRAEIEKAKAGKP